MCKEEKTYIQLPPMESDTDGNVVKLIWEYMKLPKDHRDAVRKQFEILCEGGEEVFEDMHLAVSHIPEEEIEPFQETMKSVLREVLIDACNMACWVYHHKYELGWGLQEMVEVQPLAKEYIEAICFYFQKKILYCRKINVLLSLTMLYLQGEYRHDTLLRLKYLFK